MVWSNSYMGPCLMVQYNYLKSRSIFASFIIWMSICTMSICYTYFIAITLWLCWGIFIPISFDHLNSKDFWKILWSLNLLIQLAYLLACGFIWRSTDSFIFRKCATDYFEIHISPSESNIGKYVVHLEF